MNTGASFGLFKFISIAAIALVIAGVVIGVGRGAIIWNQTGDWKPMVESTLGEIVYWDYQIYEGVESLKNTELMNSMPDTLKQEYKSFVVKQIITNILMFILLGYLLFQLGNWMAGQAAYNMFTDIIIVLVILLLVFPISEFSYGYLMHKEKIIPYRGVVQLFKADTWQLMLGEDVIKQIYSNTTISNQTIQNNTGNIIDLGGY